MAIVQCPACRKPIRDTSQTCPHCRAPVAGIVPVEPERRERRRRGLFLPVVIAAAAGAAAYVVVLEGWNPLPGAAPEVAPTPVPTPPEPTRFGLVEAKRREVFQEIVRAEDHAQLEALRRHPELDGAASPDAWRRQFELREGFRKQVDSENKKALGRRYSLTLEQLQAISSEGFEKAWPLPQRQALR
jgi:hypothetical protein